MNEFLAASSGNLEFVLRNTFLSVQKQLNDMFPIKSPRDGSTAVVCAITNNVLWTANLGDSRAILSRKGNLVPLSVDQKPDRK
jgi:protein phosphatase PTC2/3